ncbi:MAG: serine/threonine protein kinase [Deltaproteobacteria bacterium]|nr:MAG: serine/threonine protein kinase [Deltaproteobacteria bacterium]
MRGVQAIVRRAGSQLVRPPGGSTVQMTARPTASLNEPGTTTCACRAAAAVAICVVASSGDDAVEPTAAAAGALHAAALARRRGDGRAVPRPRGRHRGLREAGRAQADPAAQGDQRALRAAMEYVHGQDLAHVLHRAPHHKLHLENALHIAIGVCAGLHCAHIARDATGRPLDIVHRDVSPSNVLVSYQGAVKLVDFGVAKAATLVSETREGVIKGKYGYMSPEQCLGDPLDRRSDVFAVGILLWEMTVGRRLYMFKGELASLQRIVYVDAPRPSRFDPHYPAELEHIVMRALARDPRQRYQSAEQLQLDLEQFALDHRLAISAVSMAIEMKTLFRDQVEAWSAAERAGQSLGDHLAAASPPAPIDPDDYQTSDDDTRATTPRGTPTVPAPQTAPPASAAPAAPATPLQPLTPQQLAQQLRRSPDLVRLRPSRSVPALFVLVIVLAIAAAWLLLFQRPG